MKRSVQSTFLFFQILSFSLFFDSINSIFSGSKGRARDIKRHFFQQPQAVVTHSADCDCEQNLHYNLGLVQLGFYSYDVLPGLLRDRGGS